MTPVFSTPRTEARPKTLEDVPALASIGQTCSLVEQHIAHQERYGFSMWTLVERGAGAVIGDIGFLRHEDGVEIGWHLAPPWRGRGYATEAAAGCLALGFTELGFERVSAFVEAANAPSLRLVERLGMRFVRRGAGGVAPWEEHVATSGSARPAARR